MKRWLLIGGAVFVLAAFATAAVAFRAPRWRARVACQPASRGEYRTLARIDAEGYVYPFAGQPDGVLVGLPSLVKRGTLAQLSYGPRFPPPPTASRRPKEQGRTIDARKHAAA